MIAQARREYPQLSVRRLCALLGVGRSWYYGRPDAPTEAERDVALRDAVERVVLEFPGYGYRRVTKVLAREGWVVNHKRVLRVMRQASVLCQLRRRFVPTTDAAIGCAPIRTCWPAACSPVRTMRGWPTSPTSGCPPRSRTWRASSMRGLGAASAGTSHRRLTRN